MRVEVHTVFDAPADGGASATRNTRVAHVNRRTIVVLQLSSLLMVVWGTDDGGLQGIAMALASAMLASRAVLLSPFAWLAGAALQGYWIFLSSWNIVSQHKIFILYWICACAFALSTRNPARALRINGSRCLAVLFGLACFWKLAGGEYLDGAFFEFLELWREELRSVLVQAEGMTQELVNANYDTIARVRSEPINGAWRQLHSTSTLDWISDLVCWGTIVGEGAMALLFALPHTKLARARELMLFAFVLTVDVVFPYTGFAFAMLLAGLAQAEPDEATELQYVAVLAAHTVLVWLANGQPLSRSIAY
jgi:hypothetical protein